ncbi:alpha/beta fold hydrolase [Diaphorobacter caeni]|uniref:alpha/beta fold hydrolase n=1 Tax=Diaphorobacter caeni TaxID=2784387 RepID=UPI0018902F8E|nr:alpha/beta hydrolase [Diaphorobacter caeni]MBF5004240.1 alpha/beta hydrolase [Diaphorobacter caeni]
MSEQEAGHIEHVEHVERIPQAVRALQATARLHVTQHAGCSVQWREWGDPQGVPLVALHGGHGTWLHWVRNVATLADRYRVLLPDMPGFGDSDDFDLPARDPARLDLLVQTVQHGVEDLLGKLPFHLMGFSFGGLIAAKVAQRMPQIRTLTLLGSAGHGLRRASEVAMRNWREFDGEERALVLKENLEAFMLAGEADADACWIHEQSCEKTRFYSKTYSHKPLLTHVLPDVQAPMLLLWGERDVTAEPVKAAEFLAQSRPEREWMVIPNAGHWVQYDAASTVNVLLHSWLAQR